MRKEGEWEKSGDRMHVAGWSGLGLGEGYMGTHLLFQLGYNF